MRKQFQNQPNPVVMTVALVMVGVALALVRFGGRPTPPPQPPAAMNRATLATEVEPCALVLAPHTGAGREDQDIIREQDALRLEPESSARMERLGWAFVNKARASFDDGFFKLAEMAGRCLEKNGVTPESLLLRGHALHNLHQFREAELLARELVQRRGVSSDFTLLGDVLMEQGRVSEAVENYQRMADLKPAPDGYARIAHARWITGDLEGALEMARKAARGASSSAPPSAWWLTRLAWFEFKAGETARAERGCANALLFQTNFAPALLLRGMIELNRGEAEFAARTLTAAVAIHPLPEHEWWLAEALRAANREREAAQVESGLRAHGAAGDPRTAALFLATRGEDSATALRLAQEELTKRQDVFTHDALAWAWSAAGRQAEAAAQMKLALREGTPDARLFCHAAVIAHRAGDAAEAARWRAEAQTRRQQLLPSERELLEQIPPAIVRTETARVP